jgi:hypothetical protein
MSKANAPLFVIVRNFREAPVYLSDYSRTNSAYVWSADIKQAKRVTIDEGLRISSRARAEFNADCQLTDAHGAVPERAAQSQLSAADKARAVLARFYKRGKLNHVAFLTEMARRAEISGEKLTVKQYGLLGRIASVYVNERKAAARGSRQSRINARASTNRTSK